MLSSSSESDNSDFSDNSEVSLESDVGETEDELDSTVLERNHAGIL